MLFSFRKLPYQYNSKTTNIITETAAVYMWMQEIALKSATARFTGAFWGGKDMASFVARQIAIKFIVKPIRHTTFYVH